MIVLDASVTIELLFNTAVGARVAARIAPPELTLHSPHLIDLEIAQVIRRYALSGELQPGEGEAALQRLGQLDIERYAHEAFLPRIWSLRDNLTAYDASYVALAETLDAVLLTSDDGLAKVAGTTARIEFLGSPTPRRRS